MDFAVTSVKIFLEATAANAHLHFTWIQVTRERVKVRQFQELKLRMKHNMRGNVIVTLHHSFIIMILNIITIIM